MLKSFFGIPNVILAFSAYSGNDDEYIKAFYDQIKYHKLNDYIIEIPEIYKITIVKFNPKELLFSIHQKIQDHPNDKKKQIEYFGDTLPNNINIAPYKSIRTLYKFSIKLNII